MGAIVERLTTAVYLALGFLAVGILSIFAVLVLIPLLPFRLLRIRICNRFARAIGWVGLKSARCRVTVENAEYLDPKRLAIYACNHTSTLDSLWTIYLMPPGTVALVKREIYLYPIVGQAWWLGGHPTIVRSDPDKAQTSLKEASRLVAENNLNVIMMPEGTRSRTGKLLPFKKGVVHMALDTGLPIVPMVVTGIEDSWNKASLRIKPSQANIKCLPPMDTTEWSEARVEEHLEELRQRFVRELGE